MSDQAIASFIEGVCAGAGGFTSGTTLFPLDVIKTKMQAGHKGTCTCVEGSQRARDGLILYSLASNVVGWVGLPDGAIAREVIRDHGVLGLYKGCYYVGGSSFYEKMVCHLWPPWWRGSSLWQRRM